VLVATPGDLVFKPRGQWHTFWNAGDEPARILEIISPAGFERFFEELVDLGGVTGADPQTLAALCARYELMMDPESVPGLRERFGLRFPGEPISPADRNRSAADVDWHPLQTVRNTERPSVPHGIER
jgi:hypothetical protein